MAESTVVRMQGEGKALWMLGGLYEVKVAGAETGGAVTIMEMTIPPGMGPPPHIHNGAEAVYVLEGTLRYHIGEKTTEAGPGSFFYIPEGTLEWFEPAGDSQIRVLITYAPGGIDEFFAEAGEEAKTRTVPPPSESPPDVERLVEIAARHGLEIKPPPAP